MTRDDILAGWLVIARLNLGSEAFKMPQLIKAELAQRGWVEILATTWDGDECVRVTDAGAQVSDLVAPEWGVDPCPDWAEAE